MQYPPPKFPAGKPTTPIDDLEDYAIEYKVGIVSDRPVQSFNPSGTGSTTLTEEEYKDQLLYLQPTLLENIQDQLLYLQPTLREKYLGSVALPATYFTRKYSGSVYPPPKFPAGKPTTPIDDLEDYAIEYKVGIVSDRPVQSFNPSGKLAPRP
ncbi:hypothetical protein Phum_PHUM578810 [Pediculus humanus corporis]|uniref:Uncharacterized protein n=1 Tax=Pediculus humanus subsp. corporis TaxID=121224 RepID=E0W1L5_PEDHC|nr:uncharacterized protein Phum_PHUM578810 [Pediculus humanus corporis]EEB19521.1 hypothetical protein Phum_PHUM578810 [Pediculus humanus corporis]